MKRVLLFARDPGGANTLIPLYEKLAEQYEVAVYGKDIAVSWFAKEGIPCKDICQEAAEITMDGILAFLKEANPWFIVTGTSLDDYTERYLWKSAEKLGIKAFAILDQWMNMGIRFSKYSYKECQKYEEERERSFMPCRIFAMDSLAKEMLQAEGMPGDKVWVTGQPHFEDVYKRYEQGRELAGKDKYNVLFVSEPISQDYEQNSDACSYWGFNERTAFSFLYEALAQLADRHGRDIRLIVKPHPREKGECWAEELGKRRHERIETQFSPDADSYSLLKSVDLVCGMSSMLLLEGAICEKSIISIMIGLKRENPFILDKINVCKSCLTKEELGERLEEAVNGRGSNVSFDYIKNPTEKVIACIEKEMQGDEQTSD